MALTEGDSRVLGIEMLEVSLRTDNPRKVAMELVGLAAGHGCQCHPRGKPD